MNCLKGMFSSGYAIPFMYPTLNSRKNYHASNVMGNENVKLKFDNLFV